MTLIRYLRIVWARKWLALFLFLLVAAIGVAVTMTMRKVYVAETSLIVDIRIDPALGALAPALAAPSFMATQVEVIKSERVAQRAVKILGVERSATAVAEWREATKGKIPLERYFADSLLKGLAVDPARGSNVIQIWFTAGDPLFAQAAANAFAQAYLDVSVDLRVAPARQSATFLDDQTKKFRENVEEAQARLSKFQQAKGIVVSDERLDQETARYNALIAQLAVAQAESVETATRQRFSGSEASPDVLQSAAVQGLKTQLVSAQTKLAEISGIVGPAHPSRVQLETQIKELQQAINTETRRVAGGTTNISRGSGQKVAALQAMVNEQKKNLLALRSDYDQIAVYRRDVEAARREYDAVSSRLSLINLEGQNNQANTRILSPAIEPLEPSKPKILVGILGSILGGLAAAVLAALGLEMLNPRIRQPEDLLVAAGVPVIGVLRPAKSKKPVFRRMLIAGPPPTARPALPAPRLAT